ncbi:MAG: YibE/F family protein [Candidatus Magasanikbacteria bacterium]|jgi:uncharacterized membrane protein|nr:YibE/F family protein [Candidatus Magasanikbacteria bacterium]MBT4315326.1 YibE/F family protein [Candidatus Magasanikbacteria bacterium]MBT4547198.1 YibE/F family protein [Candidatus Magasanikbacteria bacterium]MBT6818862.1 YibE/F family protein [Candidatus Magasanikbacteria bacterium]
MKKTIILLFLITLFLPLATQAQADFVPETFEARVLEIFDTRKIIQENGGESVQQNIKLIGLSGSWEEKEFDYIGIADIEVLSMSNTVFELGDKVLVRWDKDFEGSDQFYIQNFVRRGYLYLLGLIFSVAIIAVGRKKGIRSLISLVITFFVIIKFIIPQIIGGSSPLIIALIGSIFILATIIYVTEGFSKKTHIAIVSISLSLIITFVLSYVFVALTKLTGFASEEASFLVGTPGVNIIDFRGLLLAGILIGTLGVLDDVILGQVEAVNQIKLLKPDLSKRKMIKSANEIGRTHLSSMVNTLFLTYAGASLPLLILFSINPETSVTFASALDNEFIATEIVRTLSGSIGLILAFPLTTYLAVYFLKTKE